MLWVQSALWFCRQKRCNQQTAVAQKRVSRTEGNAHRPCDTGSLGYTVVNQSNQQHCCVYRFIVKIKPSKILLKGVRDQSSSFSHKEFGLSAVVGAHKVLNLIVSKQHGLQLYTLKNRQLQFLLFYFKYVVSPVENCFFSYLKYTLR